MPTEIFWAAYQYYRWRYSQRGEEFSHLAETEIQFVMQFFQMADKAEDFVNANDDMRQQLRSVYDDACISLMTAPKSLKQKAKQRKNLLK